MNHTYRLVWNDREQCQVPAPETARSHGKAQGAVVRPRRASRTLHAGRTLHAALKPLAALISAIGCSAAFAAAPASTALPEGGNVVAGSATVAQSGARMDIVQTTDRAILEWNRFDIGAQAHVNFAQPAATSVALNRVLAGEASRIHGNLTANGQVYLVNPAGVIFGPGSRVDVGGLVATSMNIADDDFLAGRDVFSRDGATGKVVNQGEINAADGGLIALLAPEAINEGVISARLGNVVLAAGERITLEAGAGGHLHVAVDPATVSALVENRHLVQADGGQVVMSAQAADTLLSAVVANSGSVQARTLENRAGRILLLADMAQGEVKVGGLLDASAPVSGDGGFVETSAAKVSLAAEHRVTTLAANGQTGTWLIDPNDYTIAASGGNITGAQLATDLGSSNVAISTATQGTAGGNGDIFVNDAVSWSANKLTLSAERNIRINANLNGSGAAQLALEYGQGAVAAGNTADYYVNAKVNLPAGNNFSTKLGSNGATDAYTVITSLGAAGSTTATDLQGMNGNLAAKYALGADIDASATSTWNAGAGWLAVGNNSTLFTGRFAGLGHAISGLTINRSTTDNQGMFGNTDGATFRDIGLVGGSVTGRVSVGGLVGDLTRSTISNSYVTGSVSGTNYVGGLVGATYDSTTINNSYATGSVSGTNKVGGLVGHFNNGGTINNSYAMGNVSGTDTVGGLVGENYLSTINNSYATGAVTGSASWIGGLVGRYSSSTSSVVNNSYWDTDTTGQATSAAGTGKTTAQMKQQASFSGWDFVNTWRIYEGSSYPVLRAFQQDLTVTASNASKTYDGLAYSGGNGVTYSVPGATVAGALSYTGTSQSATNAGSYVIAPSHALTQQDYQNWHVAYANGALTVNPAALTVTANAASKTYDGLAYTGGNGVAYSGFVNGETSTVLGGALAYGGASQGATNAGSYAIAPSGLTSGNYTISFNNGSLTINPAALSVTASAASKTYDGLAYTGGNGVAYGGFVNGETSTVLGGALAYGGASQGATNAGSYAIAPSGLTSGNYTITFNNGSLTINPAALSVTANAASKTYDGLAYSGGNGVAYSGFVNGETTAVLGGTLAYGGTSQGATNAGSYVIAPTGLTSGNYTITFNNGSLTINPAALSVTANAATKTYDGLAYSGGNGVAYSGFVNGETSTVLGGTLAYGGASQGATNAGSYAIAPSGLTSGNYTISFNNGSLTINPAALSVTANAASKTYDGLAYTGGNGVAYSGLVNGETSAVLGGALAYGGTSQGAINAGSYVIAPSGLTSGNYTITFNDGALTINPAALTVTANAASKTYDGLAYTGGNGVAYSGFVNGETSTVLGGALAYGGASQGAINAGSYAITPSGLSSSNYTISFNDGALTINPAALSVTANAASKTYDGLAYSGGNGVAYSGFVNGETSTVLGGTLAYGGTSQGATNAGSYAIAPSGLTSGNYTISFNNGSLTVSPRAITVTANDQTRVYGSSNPVTGSTVVTTGSLVGSDAVGTATVSAANTATATANAGTSHALTPSVQTFSAGNAGNYIVTYADGALTITPASLTVTANASSKTYDGMAYTGGNGVAYSGFVNGETSAVLGGALAYGGASQGATNAGSYAIAPSGLTSGNYTITFNNGALTINPAALSVTANAASKTYDGLAYTGGNGVAYSGFVNGETSAVLGGTLAYGGVSQGATNAGSYAIAPSGLTSGNYTITFNNGVLTVSPRAITVTASDQTRVYGSPNPVTGSTAITAGSLVGSDALGTATISAANTATASANAGTSHALTPSTQTFSTGNAGNYMVTYANGTLTIIPASLTVTANAVSKTADGLAYTGGNGVAYSGLVNGETSAVLGGALSYGGNSQGAVDVGSYTITPSGLTSGNYTISFANGVLTIAVVPPAATASDSQPDGGQIARVAMPPQSIPGIVAVRDEVLPTLPTLASAPTGSGESATLFGGLLEMRGEFIPVAGE
ncbi:MAG: MBG domain-containing protein [Gallionella sp.]